MPDTDIQSIAERVGLIIGIVRGVSVEDTDAYVAEIREQKSRFDAWDAMIDPTRWHMTHESIDAATKVAIAFAEFRHIVEENVNPDA